ncbi:MULTISPECIES: hypothetical protein [Stenotrophomonas]|jgi:hypothetical protein|uniref:Uncharacterized protein n=3 Tax=cellular organisms TaxID=131567 RepID=A0AAP5CB23_9GAMM|nr:MULTISPECIES: hypothetical protein [Stenotrophomonas]KAJ9650485.1 hypothetical protein H2198_010205 [Knufia sp. JES_112]ELF4110460.1 hypothetical protein [Stenotrophomonas maltophilia]MBH1380149.1 hypothetical protein [Stenotrophomonas maltophilia]MBH1396560.1 hypothetical protein [Stenotrophomonas maltophilia]MBH1406552.1 hypothetical protein [Stenotrophomonas maltophilia]
MNDFKRDASNTNKPAVAEPDAGKQKQQQQEQERQDKESKERNANEGGAHKSNK